jgi:centromere protein S
MLTRRKDSRSTDSSHLIENVSHDLEAFAKHAGRYTINTSDVLLLARKNEGLQDVLKQQAKEVKARDKT